MENRKTEYPKVGDTIQLPIGRAQDVLTMAFYEVVKADFATRDMEIKFLDIKLLKESDIPF